MAAVHAEVVGAAAVGGVGYVTKKSSPLSVGRIGFFGLNLKNTKGFVNGGRVLRAATSKRGIRRSNDVSTVPVVAEKFVGIDFGTANSAVASLEGGKLTVVTNSEGDFHLGGDDFDNRIVDWLAANFNKEESVELTKDEQALQRLTETAEKAEMEISETSSSLPFTTATADIDTTISRAKFEELCSDLLNRWHTPVEKSLRKDRLTFKEINELISVGGSIRIPVVQELLKIITGRDPTVTVNLDEGIAIGAVSQAGEIEGSRGSTYRKAFSGSNFSTAAIHRRRMSTLSCFRAATSELVSCYSRLSGEIQNQRGTKGSRQVTVRAIQNDSNYEKEEQRWMREDQRWLREEQRWLREEKRWEREEIRWTEATQALQEEVRALKKEIQELRGQRGYGGDITDVSLRNLVAGMRNLLQALAIPGSEELPVFDSPEVFKQIPGTVLLSEGSSTAIVVGKSESVVSPVDVLASPGKVIAVVTPKLAPDNNPGVKSPTQASSNYSQSSNGATSNAPTTTATKRTMKSGMDGDDVKELHDALSELGFYSGEEDIEFSVFSGGTDRAVKTWQSTRGDHEDGKVTKELMAALLAEVEAKRLSEKKGAKSNSQPAAKVEPTKPKQPKQSASPDDSRKREIDRYERSDAQETGTGSSRRVYLLGENRWEEPGRVQKKQEEERRIKNGQPSKMKVGATMCFSCRGVGTMLCTDCEGTGDLNVEEQFLEWLEEGEAKCPYCEGSGAVECDVCFGVVVKVE